jgi:fibronectin type 3 domain-containing protein
MWITMKRFTLGAILAVILSLLIQGCGGSSGPSKTYNAQASKQIAGTVSDLTTNLPLSGATISAYAITSGAPASQALGGPINSASDGSFALNIPTSYTGALLVEATAPPAKLIDRLAKLVSLPYTSTKIRVVLSEAMVARNPMQPVMLNFASEALVVFLETNIVNSATPPNGFTKTGFSSDNIQKAIIILEALFGPHFTQFSLPQNAFDTNTTKAQQDLLVSITALNLVLANNPNLTFADILAKLVTTGLGTLADDIKSAIQTATATLIRAGTLPFEYVPNAVIRTALSNAQTTPVPPSALNDKTPPTAPSGLTAVPVNSRAVSLAWTASSDNSGNVDGYAIYRVTQSGKISLIDYVRNALAYTDFTVSPATAYSYAVVAYDSTRNYSAASDPATATTLSTATPGDTTPPTAPTGLSSKGFSDRQVNLQWIQSTKTNSNGSVVPAAGYFVYRNAQIIATVLETTYNDLSVLPATPYSYYIKAFDSNGTISAASTPLSIRTLNQAGSVAPAAPSNLALVSAALYNKVDLQWNASSTADVTYNVYRGSYQVSSGIISNRYSDSTVVPGSSYVYTVTAANSTGESSRSNQVTVVVPPSPNPNQTAPTVPQNFALVTPATSNSVTMTWAASTKPDGDRIVAGYDILRGDSTGNNFVIIDSVLSPGYTDTSVLPTTTYTYQVTSFSSTGTRSAPSATLTVITAAVVDISDTTPPSAPTNLRLNTAATSSSIALIWNASTKGTGDHVVAGYKVYRNGTQIADVINTEFIDTTVSPLTSYSYTVKAYDNPGNVSAASNTLDITTPAAAAGTFTLSGRVTLNGIGLPGVTMVLIGTGSGSVLTDQNGNYSFINVINGGYSISASAVNYLFAPENRSILVNGSNVSGLDFTASLPGTITGGVIYPTGTVIGGITYPPGTIIGGITYPFGTVIGGVTYPTATVIGGVTYPTGTVIGGIIYPNGVIIGGITYPPGTVIGGIAFPPGTVTVGITYPTGTVIGGVTYPTGTVTGSVIYPSGTIIGTVTYPTGIVIGGVNFPTGRVTGGIAFPTGTLNATTIYPNGTIVGGITYPSSTVIGGVTYPTSTVIGGVTYPTGSVVGGTTYPNGVVIGGVTYPPGTVIGGVAFPPSPVIGAVSYPTGSVSGGILYPVGTAVGSVIYPDTSITAILHW